MFGTVSKQLITLSLPTYFRQGNLLVLVNPPGRFPYNNIAVRWLNHDAHPLPFQMKILSRTYESGIIAGLFGKTPLGPLK